MGQENITKNLNYIGLYPASRIASFIFPRSVLASSKFTTASLFSRFTSTSTTPFTEAIALPTLTTQWLHSKPSILMIFCTREIAPFPTNRFRVLIHPILPILIKAEWYYKYYSEIILYIIILDSDLLELLY